MLAANYAVLTHSGNVQYSRFPGFPGKTYSRPNSSSKKILRFRRKVENEVILKSVSSNYVANVQNDIERTPIKFKVESSCEEMAFNEGNKLSLDGGEVEIREVSLSKAEIYKIVKEYIKKNIVNCNDIELEKEYMEIQPIVMDDACSENNQDKVVAYSVVFPHMYKGKSVDKENLIAIVDEQGVKYTAINWGKVKEGVQR